MDKPTEKTKEKGKAESLINKIKRGVARRPAATDKKALISDILLFATGFILCRCHLLFGAKPVGLAFLAMIPIGIWPTLAGVLVGSLTIGLDGIAFAAAAAVIILLRAAVSSGERDERGKRILFNENLLTRMAISILGGFITAVYEVLTRGINELTIFFGLTMIILTPLLVFGLSGLFHSEIRLDELLCGPSPLSLSNIEKREKYDRIYFQISSLILIFLISLSFKNVTILGISLSYIFSCAVTLLVAKRFGCIRAVAVGFVSSLCLSVELSVCAALMGLVSGAVFGFGTGYAIVTGGAILCAYSIYTDGMMGLLSTLPEYAIAAAIAAPISKKLNARRDEDTKKDATMLSEEMVGIMALSYQSRCCESERSLASAVGTMGEVISEHTNQTARLSLEEYRAIVISVAESYCIGCLGGSLCAKESIRPAIKRADRIARLLSCGEKIMADDINCDTEFCQMAPDIADEINRLVQKEERERFLSSERWGCGKEYSLISSFVKEATDADAEERKVDNDMTELLEGVLSDSGIAGGTIRAFGKRRKHIIIAAEDDGDKLSSKKLKDGLEAATNLKLGNAEYYKKDKMMLMECEATRKYSISYAISQKSGKENEVSGDTAICYTGEKDYFYSLISDGMGSGDIAKDTSRLCCEFTKSACLAGGVSSSIVHMLNQALRGRREECSSTLDLCQIDLISGDGMFIKCGAAPSYIKRGNSIFRIRSKTAPLGLLKDADGEKTRMKVAEGDRIIMLSDGICDAAEDAPWLLLLLDEDDATGPKEYADKILKQAARHTKTGDDMTVCVIQVGKA